MRPSVVAVVVPKWGLEMTEGTVSSWLKSVGDRVKRGEPLLEVESEKIVNSVDAPADGVLRRIVIAAGGCGAIGSLAAVIADAAATEEDIERFVRSFRAPDAADAPAGAGDPARDAATMPGTGGATSVVTAGAGSAGTTAATGSEVAPARVSPPVRRLAESLGVALGTVQGSGPGGRILQEDVERAARGGSPQSHVMAPAGQPQLLPWSPTRRAIARKTQASAREIPHFYLAMDVDAGALLKARERLRTAGAAPSINDLLLHATSQVLPRHPQVNAHHSDAGLLSFPNAHIAVAVATPEGVLAPVLRNADRLSLAQLAAEIAGLRDRAVGRRLAEGELDGASFTVSNLGMYGIREFTSIISAPQCASMAVGAIRDAGSTTVVTLTLSCDHRAIDGAIGAAFLRDLKGAVEAL